MTQAQTLPSPTHVAPTPPLRSLGGWVVALLVAYALTWLLTGALWRWMTVTLGITPSPLPQSLVPRYALAFFVFFMPILYLLPCALAGQWLRPNGRTLALYMGTAFFFGGGLEMTMDPAWILVLGRPCYLYDVFPVHDGATSGFGAVMWPMYGFFVAMLHLAIHDSPRLGFLNGHWPRAALLAVDAMLLEVAANVFSLLGFGTWLFRYHAPDLHHFTTIEAFPIYLFGGYLGVRVLHAGESHPKRALLGAVLYTVTLVAVFGLNCG
jgi:hypothetical protein